jgi:CxxC motif-containing protein
VSELVCIACPIGCRLTVVTRTGGEVEVTGNRCPRGETYGREEVLAPRRIVTATVPTRSALFPCAPVRTDKPLARELIPQLLQTLYAQTVDLPIRLGETLIEDFNGVRVVFTRTLPPDDVPPIGKTGPKPEGEEEVTLFHQAP